MSEDQIGPQSDDEILVSDDMRVNLRIKLDPALHAEIKGYSDRAGVPFSSFAAGLLALGLGRWESGEFSTEYGKDPDVGLLSLSSVIREAHEADVALTVTEATEPVEVKVERAKKAVADKGLKLNDSEFNPNLNRRHVHKPGEVIGENWIAGTRYINYRCAEPTCDTTMRRRH